MSTCRFLIVFSVMAIFLYGCEDNKSEDNLIIEDFELIKNPKENGETVNQLLQSIPSPIEITNAIQRSGASCDLNLLNRVSNIDHYQSSYEKSLNLGVYGTDLGYLNLYSKTGASFEYLDNIYKLSGDLKIGQFFDFSTLKRLASNKDNMDSLIDITTSGFENMNNYLSSQQRENVSTLILLGGWVESVYLLGRIAEASQDKELIERIGEQQYTLEQIILLLEVYKDNDAYLSLYNKMLGLKKIFEKVKVVHVYEEPETKEVNGMLVVIDNSKTTIEVAPEVLQEILHHVGNIRNDMIN